MVDPVSIPLSTQIIISLVTFVILLPLSALVLWISGKIFKVGITYLRALIPALIIGVVGLLLSIPSWLSQSLAFKIGMGIAGFFVSLALYLLLPKFVFNLEWKKGLLVGLVWYAIMLGLGFLIGLMIAAAAIGIALAIGFSAAAA